MEIKAWSQAVIQVNEIAIVIEHSVMSCLRHGGWNTAFVKRLFGTETKIVKKV